jgi:CHAT domain-containing protein
MWDNMDKLGLSNENNENTSDGILYAGEIYNLDIDAKLVVLSSCESGIGMLAEGEGMMALTRALLYAGAQNQIASLWKVEDKSSAELMILFYDELLSGKSIPEALRGAKLKIIEQNVPPVFWGAYVLTGE